jgi:hypothetical protein
VHVAGRVPMAIHPSVGLSIRLGIFETRRERSGC